MRLDLFLKNYILNFIHTSECNMRQTNCAIREDIRIYVDIYIDTIDVRPLN